MRTTMMLAAGVALMTAGTALAQGPGAPYPPPGGVNRPPMPQPPRGPVPGQRWGSQVGGRWWGGAGAPGGWAAYRRPHRGYRLPAYWVAPRFYVSDWSRYGLYAPTSGYNWVRYYDDAVLIDGNGGVSDWRGGLAWDGDDRDFRGPPPGDDHDARGPRGGHWEWREDGGAGYPTLPPGHPPVPPGAPLPPGHPSIGMDGHHGWHSGDGHTTVTTTTSGGYGHASGPPVIVGGYGYGGGVTTVTIQSAPVVTTTTTTEIVEDTVTYSRPVVRRIVRHRAWHAPRCTCRPVVRPVVRRVIRHRAPAVIGS